MKPGWGFLLALLVALGLVGAYLLGRSELRADASSATSSGEQDRFWRLQLELTAGSRGRGDLVPALPPPDPVAPTARSLAHDPDSAPTMVELEELAQDRLQAAVERVRDSLTGPRLEARYENGQRHFLGHQVQDELGLWYRDGPWEAWYENGQLHELGAYSNDVEHGPWQWWYSNGTTMAEGRFVDGERMGSWTFYYDTGGRMMEGAYAGHVGVGRWSHYYENGQLRAEGELAAGVPVGYWAVYLEDGLIDPERSGEFVDGELAGG